MNEFVTDNVWQRQMRDEFLVPFYRKTFAGHVLLDDDGRFSKSQQERDVDTLAWKTDGKVIAIEEKIVRYPGRIYTAVCLETESCTTPGRIARGWMWYSAADILLYCMQTETGDLDCRSIDFPKLYDWFWPLENEFPLHVMANTINKTASRIVPIERIEPFIRSRFTLTRPASQAAA
jgi:hypothetical protein